MTYLGGLYGEQTFQEYDASLDVPDEEPFISDGDYLDLGIMEEESDREEVDNSISGRDESEEKTYFGLYQDYLDYLRGTLYQDPESDTVSGIKSTLRKEAIEVFSFSYISL